RLALQTDGGGHHWHLQLQVRTAADRAKAQPPVIGGKNAISRAPAITASALTWARSIAVRITLGFSKAWAYSSPRWASHAIRSATVAMPGGGSTSSAGLPMRSRTQAKYRSFTLTDLNPSTRDYRIFRRAARWPALKKCRPAPWVLRAPAASVRDQMPDAGAEIVPAGIERQQRREPKQRQADRRDDRNRKQSVAGIARQQEADGDQLQRGLPFGEPGHRDADAQLGQIFAQARNQDLAAQDHD